MPPPCSAATCSLATPCPCRNRREELTLRADDANHHMEVQAFLILERVPGSKDYVVSAILRANGQFIGQTSLGVVAEGQEVLFSVNWDQPLKRFVASSQAAGNAPTLSFIPFASPGSAHDVVPHEFSMVKSFVLKSGANTKSEAHEN